MEVGGFKFHRLGLTLFHQLSAEEQSLVLERLAALTAIPVDQWSPALAKRYPKDQTLYLVPVDDSLRLIVRAEEATLEVVNFVRRETLELFAKPVGSAAVEHG